VDPIVEYFVKENDDLKAKLKISEDLRKEEKKELEVKLVNIIDEHQFKLADVVDAYEIKLDGMRSKLADVVNAYEIKLDAMRLKLKKIRRYAISQEAWYHYVVGSIVTLVAILIAFVVGLKFFK
jgi:hypothetical protein